MFDVTSLDAAEAATGRANTPLTDAEAHATPCAVAGCDGLGHDPYAAKDEWVHSLAEVGFDGRAVLVEIQNTEARGFYANIQFEAEGEMTAAELRAAADLYDAYPGWLRSIAERVDTLNRVQLVRERIATFMRGELAARSHKIGDLTEILGVSAGGASELWHGSTDYTLPQTLRLGEALHRDPFEFLGETLEAAKHGGRNCPPADGKAESA